MDPDQQASDACHYVFYMLNSCYYFTCRKVKQTLYNIKIHHSVPFENKTLYLLKYSDIMSLYIAPDKAIFSNRKVIFSYFALKHILWVLLFV